MTKSSTWNLSRLLDLESRGDGVQNSEPDPQYQTSPITRSATSDDKTQNPKAKENEMTKAMGAREDRGLSKGRSLISRGQKATSKVLLGLIPNKAGNDSGSGGTKKKLNHKPFTLRNQLGGTIGNSWINILLLAVPIRIALNYSPGVSKAVVFAVNLISIVPLVAMLSFATEEISIYVGENLGVLVG
ncbi:hypothetical protein BP5796_04018 [Coleophoma crateriformis]|uniref:Uncharacterized protein n=1 Tax=Coleophoma crateriformis TaxID=565419 RepID=A0A3D8SHB6_9HELO|nr:hypothetical protein BP5796_04018 [Coleophoma crateriformis]